MLIPEPPAKRPGASAFPHKTTFFNRRFRAEYILDELHEKLTEKLRVPSPIVDSIRALLMPHRLTVDALPEVTVTIHDPDDVAIVAFAMAIGADILITGDRYLLDVSDILPVRVMSPREFYDT